MRIGITGHQKIADQTWVKAEIVRILNLQNPPLIGVTSLAVGADQLFAQAILECAGALHVIVPFDEYVQTFEDAGRTEYEQLLSKASITEVLPAAASHEESYLLAGKKVVDISDLLVAVWNGKPTAGLGGTADIVEYARQEGKKYIHINPDTQQTL